MGGSCGFCGQMFIVYAQYLSLINAVLMSPVTDTSEQQHGLTQCVDDLLPTYKALEGSKTLPPACLFESEQEDRCSRKTQKNRRLPATSQLLISFLEALLEFSMCIRATCSSKTCYLESQIVARFPHMKVWDPHGDQ